MSQIFLFNATFHVILNKIDQEFANEVKQQGCPYCKGTLHLADYPRSPFGLPAQFRAYYDERLSFCCALCRRRTTSQSVRFLGRRWFPAPLLLLISALKLGATKGRCLQIRRHFGITMSESTWRRWRRWWRESFTATSFWPQAKGLLPPSDGIMQGPFPRVLLASFVGSLDAKMIFLLQFLAPLTAGVLRAV